VPPTTFWVDQLKALVGEGLSTSGAWSPLRHQREAGMGFEYVADNVGELRHRPVEQYGDAAL